MNIIVLIVKTRQFIFIRVMFSVRLQNFSFHLGHLPLLLFKAWETAKETILFYIDMFASSLLTSPNEAMVKKTFNYLYLSLTFN